jgi:hypothetical protein
MYIGLIGLYLSEAQRQSDNSERGYPPDGVQFCDRTWTVVLTGHTPKSLGLTVSETSCETPF